MSIPLLIINGILLLFVLYKAIRLIQNSSAFVFAVGDWPKQLGFRDKILKDIVYIAFTGIIGALLNVFFA